MAFCKACGTEVLDTAIVCVKCGSPLTNDSAVTAWSTNRMWGYGVLAFLIPIVGIVLGIIGLTKEPRRLQGGILLIVSIFAIGFWKGLMG